MTYEEERKRIEMAFEKPIEKEEETKYGFGEGKNISNSKEHKVVNRLRSEKFIKPTQADLFKKHNMTKSSLFFTYEGGGFIDKLVHSMMEKYDMKKYSIFKNAILYYKCFMEQNYDKLVEEEKKMEDEGNFQIEKFKVKNRKTKIKECPMKDTPDNYSDERRLKEDE